MGLFMIGYDLNDGSKTLLEQQIDENDIPDPSDDDLTNEPRRLRTLGRGNQAREFCYSGSVVEGVEVTMGHGTRMSFQSELFKKLIAHFAGKEIPGGFNMTDPTSGGIGEWVAQHYRSLTPRHASFVAAVLVAEGYCSHFYQGNGVVLKFPAVG
jgi:hypothetical protein